MKNSTLYALWQHIHPVVTNLPVIIRYFIPERYYLHFAVTAVLLFGMGQLLDFNGVPNDVISGGYGGALILCLV
jgi:hypothetical protein